LDKFLKINGRNQTEIFILPYLTEVR